MKKLSIFLIVFAFLSCGLLDEVDLGSIAWHVTSIINLESSLLGESTDISVNVAWRWLLERPSGEGIIVERSIGDASNYVVIDTVAPIETLMTYLDRDTVLQPNTDVFYRLGFLDGGSIDYFKTVEVSLPPIQHFYAPATDTIGNDTLTLVFARLQDFNDCEVSIYRAFVTDPESLMNLIDPLFIDTLIYPDTSLVLSLPDSVYADTSIYTIRLLSLNEIEVSQGGLTNVSTTLSSGFRAFFKNP
ncbi:MAG: hypothetical protein JSV53_12460 [candidate division WOR-3 bacterium]|nr:MAG: hypothetical protein JSV53_12460 [candidate division WOR-3 bacterium]